MAIKSDDKLMFEAYKRNLQEKMCDCKKCPACKKRMAKHKKKMMNEHHEGEYSSKILQMSVGDLLDLLEVEDPELYRKIEKHLDNHENATEDAVKSGMESADDDTSLESDIEAGLDEM